MAERIKRLSVPDELGCWVWQSKVSNGYGQIEVREGVGRSTRRRVSAHRTSYETFTGPIPAGLHIDHLCRNKLCVNPAHLEPVTSRVNTLRGATLPAANRAKTHCVNGHEFAGENLRMSAGVRRCRTCERANKQRYRERRARAGVR